MIAGMLSSCFQDKGNYDYADLEEVTITGIEASYDKTSLVDKITLDPVITSNKPGAEFKCWWGIYETNVQGTVPKVDTISKTKAIDYLVVQPAKGWVLVFGAKNIKTGYTKIITSNINVVTQFTRGWYVAKTENGKADLDLFLTPTSIIPVGKIENVYMLANGKNLNGKAHSINFFSDYKALTNGAFGNRRSLFVLTDQDASVVDIGTMKEIRDYSTIFYGPPVVKKPEIIASGQAAFYLSNNGKLHSIYNMSSNTGQFGIPQMVNEYNSDYKLSKYHYGSGLIKPIFYDEISNTFFSAGGGSVQLTSIRDAATTKMPSKNTNKKLLHFGYKTSSTAFALFQDITNPNLKILSAIKTSITAFEIINDTLASTEKLYNATMHTLLREDENIMYFTLGNQVWTRNLSNRFEQLQYTVPSDETISFIKHLKYSSETEYAFNYVIVATKKGDLYILRMFTKTSGNLNPVPAFTISGKGEAGSVMYISPKVSTYSFPSSL